MRIALLVSILILTMITQSGCLGLIIMMEKKALAEERRTGVKREHRSEEPWEGRTGD